MTENEALKLGKSLYENLTSNANNIIPTKEYIEFVEIAIQVLEELQMYKQGGLCLVPTDAYKKQCEELDSYKEIGTIEEFKALKDRSVAKKPIINERRFENGDEVLVDWKCPICGLNVIEETPCQEYCQRCGNKLDWQ